ncbi:hypothetical protein CDES_07470 [Corynebacterium deserti GIMN1.010]|uniref:Uncharacterized protein n=1 Tax=Corynebacterium deserti GIMN1.010 TaxID=931089 RepID=A0A0M3Q9N3_9CORY|nr:hypothetical protein [Corynebacterium deserti]ALC05903.1 hypothetical protein CDES_07470 [Corynebacterium deserti GIMN1.010]
MTTWQSALSRAAPRVLALLWAGYATTRIVAYIDSAPPQLAVIHSILPLWVPWAVAAVLLTLGALVPPWGSDRQKRIAQHMRQWGSTVSSATIMAWAAAFLVADVSRGWVSAANYVMLGVFALVSGWIMSREVASVHAIREDMNARMVD